MALRAPLTLRLAWIELRNDRRFAVLFALNLALGLCGFVALDAFKTSLDATLDRRSRSMLGADLQLVARRPIRSAERERVDAAAGPGAVALDEAEMPSMVAAGPRSRLTQLRVVGPAFPLRGEIGLRVAGARGSGAGQRLDGTPVVWLAPELLAQLDVDVGDEVRIGQASFAVGDVVERDNGIAAGGFALAPRAYIGASQLAATGLVQYGSRVVYRRMYRLPDRVDPQVLVESLRPDPLLEKVRVQSHRDAGEDIARVVGYLSDFLSLVSLVALLLAGLGAAFLFRSFLARRLRDVAVLVCVGASFGRAQTVYVWQLVLLGLGASLVTVVLSALLVPLVPWLLGPELVPLAVAPTIGPRSVVIAVGAAIGGSLLLALPSVLRLRSLKPAVLFSEAAHPELAPRWWAGVLYLPTVLLYWALASWQAYSPLRGALFVGFLAGACVLLGAALWAGLRVAERVAASRALPLRLALRHMVRQRTRTLAAFLAIGLSALLLDVVPQLRAVLRAEVDRPEGEAIPSLFLIDIQDEQVEPLRALVQDLGSELVQLSPLTRARLTHVDGVEVPRRPPEPDPGASPEEREEARLRHRSYNLSSRERLSDSERLVEGREFSGRYDWDAGGTAEMSVESEFAERLELELGDTLRFDVQGVPVSGRVVQLREIRWQSFAPNFFVQFQPGVLDDAPKIWIAALPEMSRERKLDHQREIVGAFPNVSVIDISAVVARVLGIVEQVQLATNFMAALALLAGLALIYAIASHQAEERRWETNLLKVLGADFARIAAIVRWEFGLISLGAAVLGALASLLLSWMLARWVMDAPWRPGWAAPLISAVAIPALCVLTAGLATRRTLRERPLALLQRS